MSTNRRKKYFMNLSKQVTLYTDFFIVLRHHILNCIELPALD